ncbi:MAG: hypothetical protein Q8Q04_03525 [archaeon]|nr:hypothetical protein [archaeon]
MIKEDIEKIDLKKGDLVELVLTTNARLYRGGNEFYLSDKETNPDKRINSPGRKHVGYLTDFKGSFLTLHNEWSEELVKASERMHIEIGGIHYYFDAIESCQKK